MSTAQQRRIKDTDTETDTPDGNFLGMDGYRIDKDKIPLENRERGKERAQERGFGARGVFCLTFDLPTLGTYLTLPT